MVFLLPLHLLRVGVGGGGRVWETERGREKGERKGRERGREGGREGRREGA